MGTEAKKERKVDVAAERRRRLTLEALHGALARKRCVGCTAVGAWEIYDTGGRIRYIKCKACGYCDHVPVIVQEQAGDRA